ncbi:MaoC family dehydratase [Frankia tisae]|uniref:MaoC family dehydratase n=1 Tax=Frankia tisae TaxID=2950104 RepID=UPI0021BFA81D|nr:MaoC family dehydratase [Frankia tisae]
MAGGGDGRSAADGRPVIEQRGLYYDELAEGVVYRHRPGRTVGEADNTLFTTLTMNMQALHLDEAWSAAQPFGQRLVNSLFTLSTLVGLSVAQLTQGTTVANLGFGAVRFPAPVFVGDTLYAETVVLSRRPSSSRPDTGVVEFEHTARNQNGVVVATATRSALMLLQPAGTDAAEAANTTEGAAAGTLEGDEVRSDAG